MDIVLRHGLSFCIASDRAIFLDLPQNRYFCLSRRANDAFIALADDAAPPCDRARLESHLPAGLLAATGQGTSRSELMDWKVVAGSLIDGQIVQPTKAARCHALFHLATTGASIKLFSLARIISNVERRKAVQRRNSPPDTAALAEVVAAHEKSSLHFTRHDRCLPRSVAMTQHLLSAGIVPTLVFAVMVRPFQAHCWVQHDDLVLNDHLDNVRNFTPILIV